MPRADLNKRSVSALSVCGKMLRKGQTVTVLEEAVGPRERKMASRGRILIRSSNQSGQVKITAV
jgi:hypothetical protein